MPGTVSSPRSVSAVALPAEVLALQRSAMAANTQVAYRTDWRSFALSCRLHGLPAMPASPQTVCMYLADLAGRVGPGGAWLYAPSTLSRRLAALTKMHELAGHVPPTRHPAVTTTMSGIRRERARPTRRMHPLLLADLRTVLAAIDTALFPAAVIGLRDAALLTMGFAGAFRRSELAGLTVADVTSHPEDGLHIRLRRSKTDQEGRGSVRALPFGVHPETCPPCAWTRWLEVLTAFEGGGRGSLRPSPPYAWPDTITSPPPYDTTPDAQTDPSQPC